MLSENTSKSIKKIMESILKKIPLSADFYISAINKDDNGAIAYVCVSLDLNKKTTSELMSTECVCRLIKKGVVFFTSVYEKEKWRLGARVELYGEDHITTSSNADESDNLENLPEFFMNYNREKITLELPKI